MAGLFSKLARFASSPKGQRLIHQARKHAAKPRNRAKLQRLLARLTGRGRGGGHGGGGGYYRP
ncbi:MULTISPECIES: hypothetical protein [unclassified Crossiella]|uniref:hypothetical protein n=1 Tax=unclassified Crossiella TaxID=2620835 RepID=UPI001FFF26D3|nr:MULTISPECIES: hypothetical protein [unclassified Crossiella]MCK2241276.1 hypothetical protein [Crossiella sp. S99.2]MCK2253580.1 hypothetical protein [Crossiella sp. S99.1]